MIRHSFEVQKPIVLFDGMCNFCSGVINCMARHDTKEHFVFSATQTDAGKKILKSFSIENIANESVILIEPGKIFIKSTAALRIYRQLNGLLPLLYVLVVVPRFIRNAIYNLIARNRYKWFGKRETCMVPDEKMRKKFLE